MRSGKSGGVQERRDLVTDVPGKGEPISARLLPGHPGLFTEDI